MKFDKDMLMKIALIVFGMVAGIAGYEVVQEDDSVTVALPAPAEEAKAEELAAAPASSEAPAEPEAPTEE